jgi:hypothetical protein
MNECKQVKKLLAAFFSDELKESESRIIQSHIEKCPSCREEYNRTKDVFAGIGDLLEECDQVSKTVNWEGDFQESSQNPISLQKANRFRFPSLLSGWKVASFAFATVFIMGMLAGYFIFRPLDSKGIRSGKPLGTGAALQLMENALSRKQVLDYFTQTQLVLTGIMEKCQIGPESRSNPNFNVDRIRRLLKKNRFFSQDLNRPEFMSSRNLLNRIEFILFEILTLDGQVSCEKLQRLQRLVQQERLLLKIRLIQKELTTYEV